MFHRQLESIQIKLVTEKRKPNELQCKVEAKQFKFIRDQLLEFLEKLRIYIIAITRNKNWVGSFSLLPRSSSRCAIPRCLV